jgi:putative transposase
MAAPPNFSIPNNKALRVGRRSEPWRVYLITIVTRGREPYFSDWLLASAACRSMNNSRLWTNSQMLSWVLMPDHWHGLIQLGESETLPDVVRRFKATTALQINRAMARRGAIWQRGYHDRALRANESLRAAARYIIGNPLRSGIVDDIRNYPFWDAVWLKPDIGTRMHAL